MSTLVPAAVVLYRPDAAPLRALLEAMGRGGRPLFIFVNGEIGPGIEAMLGALSQARIHRASSNVGLGHALNELAQSCFAEGYEHLLLLDQDSQPAPDLPEDLRHRWLRFAAPLGPLAAVGPLLTPAEPGYRPIRNYWINASEGRAAFLPTSGSLISARAFAEVGRFRADYFIGGIDVEWGLRGLRKGYACVIAKDVSMPHRWGVPVAAGEDHVPQILRQSPLRSYYHLRNTIDLLRSARPPVRVAVGLTASLSVQLGLLLGRKWRDTAMRRAVLAGLRDGFAQRLGPAPADVQGL
jgi:rhamnosyltransferase